MEPIAITFVLTAIVGLLGYVFLVFNFNYWKKRGVDGPSPKILFGNLPNSLTQKRNVAYDVDDIYRAYKNKERFTGIFSLRIPQLLITDPKLCQEILVANFKNFHDNEMGRMLDKNSDPILGRNPFFLNGGEWKDKRSEVTPALTSNRIKASYPVMQEVCKKMTNYLEAEIPIKGGMNAKDLAAKFTTEVVANCIYGIEAGAFTNEKCEIREMGSKIMSTSFSTVVYFTIAAAIPKVLDFYKMPMVSDEVTNFFTNLMKQSIQLRKETKSDRTDFLNYLLQLQEKKNLSSLEMAAHTMTFFVDGFETSSLVIANCLHLLAENPKVQQRLRAEINAAYVADGDLSYEKLQDLPYLDQCVNETLRIRPPLMYNNKLCTESYEIRSRKDKVIKVNKGDVVVLPYYSIHHDDEYYPDPEKFDPDRFSPENGGVKKYKDLGVFLTFGDGPRICLGMRFGLCQVKAAIACIIQSCEVTLNPKTKSKFTIDPKQFLCMPDGGTWLDFKRTSK